MSFQGIKYMRPDGAAWSGYAACMEGDRNAFAVVALEEAARKCNELADALNVQARATENPVSRRYTECQASGARQCAGMLRAMAQGLAL